MKPVIGITSYVEDATWGYWHERAALIPIAYVRAVEEAGGRPLIVPPSNEATGETLDALDGVVFSGGADLDPVLYGSDRHPATTGTSPERDRGEMALMEAALARGVPTLAICRGMQLLNVVRGGTLLQHLPEAVGADTHKQTPGEFARHDVDIEPDSALGRLLGDRTLAPSHHHQAPDRLGEGLRPVAWSEDKTVEGIEDSDGAMVLGVLWHPEEVEDRALFEELVGRAQRYREERS